MTVKGIEFDPLLGRIRIVNGSRVVATTQGTLICLLGTLVNISGISVSFPDGQFKDSAYAFLYTQTRAFDPAPDVPDHYRQTNECQTIFTRRPEEYLQSQNLIAAPSGADIFVGHVQISRTVAPTHTWAGDTLQVLPVENQWIPLTGSMPMEEGIGLTRLMHIYPSGGQLKLERQMSIGPYTGGYGSSGVFTSPSSSVSGREVVYDTGPGVPVWMSTASPYHKTSIRDTDTDLNPSDYLVLRKGQANACSLVDPTNYLSTYNVSVRGYFGRRS